MFDTPPLLSPPPDTPSSQLQSSLLSNCSLISHTSNGSNNSNSNINNNSNSSINAKIVPQSPTGFHFSRNISVVDLNNKETTSILYLMMQQQKQQQMQQQQQFKLINSPLITNSQVFTMSPYSSSPSSTTSLPLSPIKSPESPLSMSPTSNSNMLSMNPTQLVRQSSIATTTAQLSPFTSSQPQHQHVNNIVGNKRIANQFFKIINLNKTNSCSLSSTTNNTSSITSTPLSSSTSSSLSAATIPATIPAPTITTINDNKLPVMSQENLSQQHQQQQQQQLTNSTINNNNNNNENFSNTKQYIPLNSNVTVPVSANDTNGNVVLKLVGNEETLLNNNSNNTNLNDNCNQLNGANVAPIVNDSTLPIQQSVTVNSQLGHVELKKLQQQAAANQLSSPSGHNLANSIASTTSITTTAANNNNNNYNQNTSGGEETEEENDVLEDSPDGRWIKRNESVSQRDVPGIDQAYLAMDTEYGIEVVWNEIILSDGRKMKNKQDQSQIDLVFENLINLNHPNIVKFHKHWRDPNKPRIVFITEYMSSGSLKQFLRKAKRTNQKIKMQTWKRWCIQLLTALHYLHNCDPPIIHGDLSCDTIFIQHNGLIKIGSIAPDIVNQHVKTCIDKVWWSKNAHFMAPELKEIYNSSDSTSASNLSVNGTSANQLTTSNLLQIPQQNQTVNNSLVSTTAAVDIYAFGMVALEMFHLDLGGNGDTHAVTPELIKSSIECLDVKQRDFITRCLQPDPKKRPTAKQLLFDPLLFEVPTLRLLAAHQYIKHQNESRDIESFDFRRENDCVIATTNRYFEQQTANNNTETTTSNIISSTSSSISSSTNSSSNSLSSNTPSPTNTPATLPSVSNATSRYIVDFKYSSLPPFEANKYLEDVKNGIYPLTAYGLNQYNQQQQQQQINKQKHHQQQQILADQMHLMPTLDNQTMLTVNNEINLLTNTPSFSPTNTSISGTSTSIANMSSNQLSSNQSSNSSSSSTSPSQSLTQQQQQHLIHNEPIHAGDFLMDNQDLESEMANSLQHVTNAFTHASASVQQQQQQQQFYVNNMDAPRILNSSPSASPPPFQPNTLVKQLPDNEQLMQQQQQQQQQQQFNFSDQLSRTQSPITTTTTNILNNNANLVQINGAFPPISSQSSPPQKQQPHIIQPSSNINEKLGETNLNADTTTVTNTNTTIPVEKRHAIKIQFNLKCIEKLHNYQLSLNIVFDDNTTRFLESQININKDNPYTLSQDLIDCGLVSEIDKTKLCEALTEAINTRNDETPNSYFLSK